MQLDSQRTADAAARAREFREEARDLRTRAQTLEAKAKVIEHTWSIAPTAPDTLDNRPGDP